MTWKSKYQGETIKMPLRFLLHINALYQRFEEQTY